MDSNIEFKSNVYPITGSVQEDRKYLSQIHDFNKLKSIDERFFQGFSSNFWSEHQKRIISELPTCSLDKYHDPCWGMVKDGDNYRWECKCLNTDCKKISSCRSTFDTNELNLFSPKYNSLKGYSYDFCEYKCKVFHVLFDGEEYFYGHFNENKKNNVGKCNDNQSQKNVQEIEIVAALKKIEEKEEKENKENKENKESIDIIEEYTSKKQQESDCLPDEISPNLKEETKFELIPNNIFEHFRECEQEYIISASSKDVMFVDAGPGTGKTYTLIQKINHMITEEGVDPEGILVLCFTNAAVDEARDRLRKYIESGADRGLANVDIRTFHSFSWWLIGQANELFVDDGWQKIQLTGLSFDTSIKTASQIISRFSKQIFEGWEHFIVDEVQDLTNDLARLVLKTVNGCLEMKCGITVFGDSCQAIYDYTQENNLNPMTSEAFYNALFIKLNGRGQFLKLIHNFRQSDTLINMTSDLRNSILSQKENVMRDATSKLMSDIKLLPKTGLTITDAELSILCTKGKICMLLRNNGQTLKLSSTLRKRGIPHLLNVTETSRNYAPWIAEVFYDYTKPQISFDIFEDRYNTYVSDLTLQASKVWERLQELLHVESEILPVKDLLSAICYSKIDDPILRITYCDNIIVSNIHRAKGREYECVILDQSFGESLLGEGNKSYEYKTMYVAVTRPKNVLLKAPLQLKNELYPIEVYQTKRKRWGRTKCKKIVNLEFNSSIDINIDEFALINQKAFSGVTIGDEIFLKRDLNKNSVNYQVFHEDSGEFFGKISNSYIDDILSYMRIPSSELINMPSIITDLYINGIYSQIVDDDYLKLHPEIAAVVPSGVWKRFEIIGVGHFDYDVY